MPDVKVEVIEENPIISVNAEQVTIEAVEETTYINIGVAGPQGPRGTGILNGVGAPSNSLGIIGDFYLNVSNMNLYGPKTSSGWGTPVDLVGNNELGYVHTQNTPSNTWNITHGLGFVPNITVVDSGGNVVEGSYNYPNNNSVVLTFNGVLSGKAYLS